MKTPKVKLQISKLPTLLGLEKLHPSIQVGKANPTDAGIDLFAARRVVIGTGQRGVVPTGIKVNIPAGYYGKIFDRSGIASKDNIIVKAGVVDAGYVGEVGVVLQNCGDGPYTVDAGIKIAQMVIHVLPEVEIEFVDTFDNIAGNRGEAGYGSSDVKQLELPLQ